MKPQHQQQREGHRPIERYDVACVGLGGVGSFALRSLCSRRVSPRSGDGGGDDAAATAAARDKSDRPLRVLGIEQYRLGHEFGSSHGGTRIFRHAYFEHADYVPLLLHSTEEFRALERSSGVSLLEQCGTLIVEKRGPAAVETTKEADDEDERKKSTIPTAPTSVLEASRRSAELHGIPVETLEADELRSRYPQFDVPDDAVGLFEPTGGFVRPERAVTAAVREARIRGGDNVHVMEDTRVVSMDVMEDDDDEEARGGVRLVAVTTRNDDGVGTSSKATATTTTIVADRVIVACGAWTSRLVPRWGRRLEVTRQVQAWFRPDDKERRDLFLPSSLPTWYLSRGADEPGLYGIPIDPTADSDCHPAGSKIALHGRGVPIGCDVDEYRRPPVSEEELEVLRQAAGEWIVELSSGMGAAGRIVDSKSCMYTMSPDEHFLLDSVDRGRRVWCVAGLSGHGFKLTPALGRAVADLAVDGVTDLPVDFLSVQRFENERQSN